MRVSGHTHTLHHLDSTNTGSVCYHGEQTGDKYRNSKVQPRMRSHFQMKISSHICAHALKLSCHFKQGWSNFTLLNTKHLHAGG